jgi:hypothetical protein
MQQTVRSVAQLTSDGPYNFLVSKAVGASTLTQDGQCKLAMANDGSLTFVNTASRSVMWALPAAKAPGASVLSLDPEGALTHIDSAGTVLWKSGTEHTGMSPYRLGISSCNLMLQDATNSTIWMAPTTCRAGTMVPAYGQCGGEVCPASMPGQASCSDAQYAGTCCPSGFACRRLDQLYWQCRPTAELLRATSTCDGSQPGALQVDAACGGFNMCGQDALCEKACCRSGTFCQRQSAAKWSCRPVDSYAGGLLSSRAAK